MGTRALILNFAVWTLIGAFQASTWILAPALVGSAHPARFLMVALFNAYVWAVLTPPVFRLGIWVNGEREERLRRVALISMLGLALSAIVTVMAFAVHR